jgi:uncharacterized membrane protein
MGTPQVPRAYAAEDVEPGKLWAILGYLIPILVIVPLLQKDNDFALFHARQALVLLIFSIPTCGGCLVGTLVLAVLGLINSINGRYEPLPLIGRFGEEWFGTIQKTA